MQALGEAYYGRTRAYRAALAEASDDALAEAVNRNVYGAEAGAAQRLAAYMRQAARELAVQGVEGLKAGKVNFPDPISVPGAAA